MCVAPKSLILEQRRSLRWMMAKRADIRSLRHMIVKLKRFLPPRHYHKKELSARITGRFSDACQSLMTENPAAVLGAKGGQKMAQHGPEYFAKIAAMRKTHGGVEGRRNN
jgi:hypothetical protein